jgi:hypothetical protein
MPDFASELRLPIQPAAVSFAREYTRAISALAQLPSLDSDVFVDAVTAACNDIIGSTESGGDGLILRGVVTPTTVSLTIREQGKPFDPSVADATGTGSPVKCCDWASLRHAVDEAHWCSRGSAGMELKLLKRCPQIHIVEQVPGLKPLAHDVPVAPEQVYVIRRFQPEDAVGVACCVYESYGYTYGYGDLYYPDRIVHLNGTRQLISIVAIDQSGGIVGHLALERSERIAESSEAVVSPAHRGRHLLERLRTALEEEARRMGLEGVVGYPVTTHIFSQRMEEKFGAVLCGVALGQMPQSTVFKNIAGEPAPQRISTMFYFKYLAQTPSPTVYAPHQHRPIMDRLYSAFGLAAEFRASSDAEAAAVPARGHLTVKLDRDWGFGEIHVEIAGEDTATEICQAKRDLVETDSVEVIYLFLPLAQPATPALCAAAEAEGFFWSGVIPRAASDGDMLCLQYLKATPDLGLIQVAGPAGRALLDYVAAERRRVRAGLALTTSHSG